MTRFVGRDEELDELASALRYPDVRLLTVVGPAGCGKTRLVLELAERFGTALGDENWFVRLDDASHPAEFAPRLRACVGLGDQSGRQPLRAVAAALGAAPGLLVLDGIERLVGPEMRRDLGILLREAPRLKILTTSRRAVQMERECLYGLCPLPVPTGIGLDETVSCPSVQLLVDRARLHRPDFAVTGRNVREVAELCRELEGLPLAIELAAMHAGRVSPAGMLTALEDRLRFLASSRRTAPLRHQSLEAALSWSIESLAPPVRQFFFRLAVFGEEFSARSAEWVCEEPLSAEMLELLAQWSLVEPCPDHGRERRFRLAASARDYGRARWDGRDAAALAGRHAAWRRRNGASAAPAPPA